MRKGELMPVYTRDLTDLISLGRANFNLDEACLQQAQEELLLRRQERVGEGFSWGYLLGVEINNSVLFPYSTTFIKSLHDDIAADLKTRDFVFSFCKVYRGQPVADKEGVHYEGMHLDTHPALSDTNELLRMLFNFSEYPRQFYYALTDRHELLQYGVELDRTDYKILQLPEYIKVKKINIPGRRGNLVHYLKFWASVIPHVGITDQHGYFLVSFETLRKKL